MNLNPSLIVPFIFMALSCGTASESVQGGGGQEAASERPQTEPLSPEEVAELANRTTLDRLESLNRARHDGKVSFVGAHDVGAPDKVNPGGTRVERYVLSNGLTILVWVDRSAPVFAYQTWFGVGSRHERPGKTGIAHLFEHLMFKETKNLKEGEFDRLMEAQGAQTNAATWLDWTMYREELPSGNLELAVRLESDRLEHMTLNDDQLESEREVVKNERRYRVDNDPEGTMFEVLYSMAFERHPYGWPTIGWEKDIDALTLEDCLEFYASYYTPNNATIVVVGDVDTVELLSLVNTYYGHLRAVKAAAPDEVAEPQQVSERRRLLTMPMSSPKLLLGYKIPALGDEGHAAIQVLHKILFGGKSGRLYKRLVVDLEVATDAAAWVGEFQSPGLYEILVTLRRGVDPGRVQAIIDEELAKISRDDVAEAELAKAKNQLEALFLRNIQSVGDRAYGLGHYTLTTGDFKQLFEVVGAYRDVDASAVREAAARHLRKGQRSVVIAMPKK